MTIKPTLGIGELSKRTGVKIETIRYYERKDLIENPPRSEGGHRCYDDLHVKRLLFIRRSRQLGFTMDEIRELLLLVDGGAYTCGEIRALTLEHADNVREKIEDLLCMEATLLSISAECHGGSVPDCPIIDSLSAA